MSERNYTTFDKIFGIVCLVLGYLTFRISLLAGEGLGMCLVAILVLIAEVVYLAISVKKAPSASVITAFIVTFILSLGFLFTSVPQILFLNSVLVILGQIYIFYIACQNTVGDKLGDYFFFDMIKSVFILPFVNFAYIFPAIFRKSSDKKGKKYSGSVLIGLAVAIIPVIVIIALLVSADEAFKAVINKIFDFNVWDVFVEFFYVGFGVPIAMYLFGTFYGNSKNPMPQILSREACDNASEKSRFIPRVTMCAAIIPIVLVYVGFFASQCIYFVSALHDMLPKSFNVVDYARNGFFELCAICVINFVIICAMTLLTKRRDSKEGKLIRVLKGALCVCTEAFVFIDIAKMFMYIKKFGLTQKRVLTSWFMAVLGLVFLIILLKQIFVKFKVTIPAVSVAVIMSFVLIFANVDAVIAHYNVSAYLSNKLESVDVYTFYNLDDSAVPYVVPLLESEDYDVRHQTENYLRNRQNSIAQKEWYEYNLHTFRAKSILSELDFIEK